MSKYAETRKEKKQLIILIIVFAVMIIAAICIYIRSISLISDDGVLPGNYNVIEEQPSLANLSTEIAKTEPEISETAVTTEQVIADSYDIIDALLNDDPLCNYEGLIGAVHRHEREALTVTFDDIDFYPGMTLSNIIDNSDWYIGDETETVAAGGSGYVTLLSDYWSQEDFKLTDQKVNRNGDIIVWVHNYSDEDMAIRDCIVYKYQISYVGCWSEFSKHPTLSYLGKYGFGSTDYTDEPAETVRTVTISRGECKTVTYGDTDSCSVVLYIDNDDGLMGITVFCNACYGPEFDERG